MLNQLFLTLICEHYSHYFAEGATYVISSFHFAFTSSDD